MTIYRKFAPTEIEAIANYLQQQLSDGILPEELLENFKFRGSEGHTWTVSPQTGAWYRYESGNWPPAKKPYTPMDGTIDLLETVTLPLSPLETRQPEENEPAPPDADIRQMLERATRRVRDSYNQGKINSAGAENLLKDLYLLDPAGLIWSYGMHTDEWYFFRQDDWEISVGDGPNPQNFQPKQSDSPKNCGSCGTPLNGGKFCSECGSPAPQSEGPYTQAAKEVVRRFTESGAVPLPEQIVPDWKPAPGFPGTIAAGASAAAAQISSQQPQWKLRISHGVGAGQSFALGAYTRLGRTNANEIVLAEQQSSRLHAMIQRQENSYVIADQNSTNGTFVNGVRIQSPTRLHPGDTISIGDTYLLVEEEPIAPATIVRPRPPQAQPPPGPVRPAPPASPPKTRNRLIILLAIMLFLVVCLCLCALSLGGFFYYENQSLAKRNTPDETFAQPPEEASGDNTSPTAIPTPTVLASEITDSYGHSMVLVPAGAFEMGGDADIAVAECLKLHEPEGCDRNMLERIEPIHTVTLGDYYMDKYEVTNAQFTVFLNEQGNQEEAGTTWLDDENGETLILQSSGSWQPKDDFANHPVVRVNWYGARAYCQWRGARLPTEAEWEKAARGTDGRLYPWGNVFDGGRLNFCDGNCSMLWASTDHDDGYSRTAPVGSYSEGVSPYGLYDMAGNVSEWVADFFDVYPGGDPESSEFFGREYRVARGGSWDATGAIGTTYRAAGEPDKPSFPTGFRCASLP